MEHKKIESLTKEIYEEIKSIAKKKGIEEPPVVSEKLNPFNIMDEIEAL